MAALLELLRQIVTNQQEQIKATRLMNHNLQLFIQTLADEQGSDADEPALRSLSGKPFGRN